MSLSTVSHYGQNISIETGSKYDLPTENEEALSSIFRMLLREALKDATDAIAKGEVIDRASVKVSAVVSDPGYSTDGSRAWNFRFNAEVPA